MHGARGVAGTRVRCGAAWRYRWYRQITVIQAVVGTGSRGVRQDKRGGRQERSTAALRHEAAKGEGRAGRSGCPLLPQSAHPKGAGLWPNRSSRPLR